MDAVFGTFVLTDKNDDWLNIYATEDKEDDIKGIDKCPPQPTKCGVILSPRKAVCTVLLLHGVYLLGG